MRKLSDLLEGKFFGGNELDISGMILYTVLDNWVKSDGRLSFIITGTNLRSPSAAGFRRFMIPKSTERAAITNVPLQVSGVDDFTEVRPFKGLNNPPTVIVVNKGRRTEYPVPYRVWSRKIASRIPDDATRVTADRNLVVAHREAHVLSGEGRRWIVLPQGRFSTVRKLDGKDNTIVGRKGILTDLNGAYFVSVVGPAGPGVLRVTSNPEEGNHPIPRVVGEVEVDLLYPLLKGGKDVRAFYATISDRVVIIPNQTISPTRIDCRANFARRYKRALRYFDDINRTSARGRGVRHHLEERSTYKGRLLQQFSRLVDNQRMRRADVPFWCIYNVGAYTFAPYKVVWAEIAGSLAAAVVSVATIPGDSTGSAAKPIIPDHKVYFAAFSDIDHAHFVCALMNATQVREFADAFTSKLAVGTLFKQMHLPAYQASDPDHMRLVDLSRRAHSLTATFHSVSEYDRNTANGVLDETCAKIDAITERLITRMACA